MTYKKGYHILTLMWNDGKALIPINICLVVSFKISNVIESIAFFDNRRTLPANEGNWRRYGQSYSIFFMINVNGKRSRY